MNAASATKPSVSSCLLILLAAASLMTLAAGCSAAPLSAHHDRVLAEQARYTDTTVTSADGMLTLAAGREHVCGIRADGAVLCWGSHAAGQLGRPDLPTRRTEVQGTHQWAPEVVDGVQGAAEITAGNDHTCVRHVDDVQLRSPDARADRVSCWGHGMPQAAAVELDGAAVGLASGAAHSCALLDDATIECWGWSDEVGLGELAEAPASQRLEAPELDGDPIAVLAAGYVTCAPLDTGRTACWSSRVGQTPQVSYLPDAPDDLDLLAMDDTRLCAARGDHNRMYCWEISALNWAHERDWRDVRVQAPDVSWVATGIESLVIDTGRPCTVYADHIACDALADAPMPSRHQQIPKWVRDRADVVDVATAYGWGCMVDEAGETQCWGQRDERGDARSAMTPVANDDTLPADGISLVELELLQGAPVSPTAPREALTCAAGTTKDTTPNVERCLDALDQPTGPARVYHADGSLRAEGRYRGGAREGRWIELTADGAVVASGNYRNGARDGAWTGVTTLPDGSTHTVWQGSYREGQPHGTWVFQPTTGHEPRTAYFDAGVQTAWMLRLADGRSWELVRDAEAGQWRVTDRDGNGAVRYRASVAAPDAANAWSPERVGAAPTRLVLDGPYEELYPDGTVAVSGQYVGGEPEGTWKTFFANGTQASERTFAAGVAQGPAIDWHDDGNKAREGRFVDGLPDGIWQTWHRNGQLASRGDFDEGMPQGRWTWYYEDGTRKRQGEWHDPDEPIRGKQIDRAAHAAGAEPVFEEVALEQTVGVTAGQNDTPFDAAALTAERLTALERLLVVGIEQGVWQSWTPDGELDERTEFKNGIRQ